MPKNITMNGRKFATELETMSYEKAVELAHGEGQPLEDVLYTVTWKKSPLFDGMLTPNQEVYIEDGMIFNVTATDGS